MKNIYVLLPVFNESQGIYNLLKVFEEFFKEISLINSEVIVINDFSSDDTATWIEKAKQEFKKLNIQIINHDKNKGLAEVFKTGFFHIREHLEENDIIITMDGDNTHNPYLINEMIKKINEGADLVIASRYLEQSRVYGLSKLREFLSTAAGFLYSSIWRIKGVKDYTCGFRAYKGRIIQQWMNEYKENFIQERGFTVNAEILKKINKFNPLIVEVPMILRYSNKIGVSNMKILNTIKLTLEMLWRYKL